MEKWFAPIAIRRTHGLEKTKTALTRLLLLTNIKGITSKSNHTLQYPDLLSTVRPVTHNEEWSITKPPENLTFDDKKILMKITESKKGTRLIEIRDWKQVDPHLNHIF
jgi:hypothetical protein